jgi:hypothetical protein
MSQDHNHLNHATWECKYHVVFRRRCLVKSGGTWVCPLIPSISDPPSLAIIPMLEMAMGRLY